MAAPAVAQRRSAAFTTAGSASSPGISSAAVRTRRAASCSGKPQLRRCRVAAARRLWRVMAVQPSRAACASVGASRGHRRRPAPERVPVPVPEPLRGPVPHAPRGGDPAHTQARRRPGPPGRRIAPSRRPSRPPAPAPPRLRLAPARSPGTRGWRADRPRARGPPHPRGPPGPGAAPAGRRSRARLPRAHRIPERRQVRQCLRHPEPFCRPLRRIAEHPLHIFEERPEPQRLVHPPLQPRQQPPRLRFADGRLRGWASPLRWNGGSGGGGLGGRSSSGAAGRG